MGEGVGEDQLSKMKKASVHISQMLNYSFKAGSVIDQNVSKQTHCPQAAH